MNFCEPYGNIREKREVWEGDERGRD